MSTPNNLPNNLPNKLPFKPRLKASERRALIERAAAALFAEQVYDGCTLEEIATAAGVTKRVLYDHYRSKRDLQITLINRHTDELLAVMRAQRQPSSCLETRLAGAAEAFFGFIEGRPYAWRMLFRDPPTDPLIAHAHADAQRRATAAITELLAVDPQLRRHVPDDRPDWLEMLAVQLKAAGNGLAGWWYEHPEFPARRSCPHCST